MKGQEWYQTDEVAEAYDAKRFSNGGRLIDRTEKGAVLDALSPVEGRRILEIACGTGRFSVALAERGADVVGLDISGPMLRQGHDKAVSAGVRDDADFLRGDAGRLPFPDDHFDAVLAMRFFHLVDDPAGFLAEIERVSRHQVVFDTFDRPSLRTLYTWALPMGSRLYGRSEVRELLADADLDLAGVDHEFLFPYGFYRQIPARLADWTWTVDESLRGAPGVDRLATVSFWDCRVGD
ncbi:class I SAM-dependent methyltransferase [Halococcoides cellulosivorans]|uniref:SAM-dependent methyltransferase n=1 Tax=Halococcoides cellulosivorans TaxID=1679096 RepID=A0A2R4X4H2_9EURY|nr:class I SAM-dependent methyltransferase [Halococcoides cellulosivorans]AWB28692.1 SAM-dependent methyltransferase [Halococcoides cellulosivorans]